MANDKTPHMIHEVSSVFPVTQDQSDVSEDHLSVVNRWHLSSTELCCSLCHFSHRTGAVHFSYLMPPIEQQSSRGQSGGSEHRELIFSGQPPPQIPFKFIHLCTSASASGMGSRTQKSPWIRRFLSTDLHKKWCIYERLCGVFLWHTDCMTWLFRCGINCCVITESDLAFVVQKQWQHSLFICSISLASRTTGQKNLACQEKVFHRHPKDFSRCWCWCNAHSGVFFVSFGIDGFAFRNF